jgi:hypothetical protein
MRIRTRIAATALTVAATAGGLAFADPGSARPAAPPADTIVTPHGIGHRVTRGDAGLAAQAVSAPSGPHAGAIAPAQAGPYTWQNSASGACLDQDYAGGTPHIGVLAFPCNGGYNQRWWWSWGDAGTIRMFNSASGSCLDQDYSGGTPHIGVVALPCNGSGHQRWIPYRFNDGSFVFQNFLTEDVLDQDYSGGVPHPYVIAWPGNGGTNQHWH